MGLEEGKVVQAVFWIRSHEGHFVGEGLADEHTVERVLVMEREVREEECCFFCQWKGADAVLEASVPDILGWLRWEGELANGVFDRNFGH